MVFFYCLENYKILDMWITVWKKGTRGKAVSPWGQPCPKIFYVIFTKVGYSNFAGQLTVPLSLLQVEVSTPVASGTDKIHLDNRAWILPAL
jgi:hypothetical protein